MLALPWLRRAFLKPLYLGRFIDAASPKPLYLGRS